MNLENYLSLLNITNRENKTSLEDLKLLHMQHLFCIPFNNFYLHAGHDIKPRIELDHLYDKVILKRHGGFCFELNGIFGWLLEKLGYKVQYISACVNRNDNSTEAKWSNFTHLNLLVSFNDMDEMKEKISSTIKPIYFVDVGFGSSPIHPLIFSNESNLVSDEQTLIDGYTYRFVQEDKWYISERKCLLKNVWIPRIRWLIESKELKFPDAFQDAMKRKIEDITGWFHRYKFCYIHRPIYDDSSKLVGTYLEGINNDTHSKSNFKSKDVEKITADQFDDLSIRIFGIDSKFTIKQSSVSV